MIEHWNMQESVDNWITFLFSSISEEHKTKVQIFNSDNKEIRTILNEIIKQGEHEIIWDGKDDSGTSVPCGLYYYQVTNGDYSSSKKNILL